VQYKPFRSVLEQNEIKKKRVAAANREKDGGKIFMPPCQSESALKCLQSKISLFLLKT